MTSISLTSLLGSATTWVPAVETGLVRLAVGRLPSTFADAEENANATNAQADALLDAAAFAALAAISSRFMAIGTPMTLGLVGVEAASLPAAALLLAAHDVYFAVPEIRVLGDASLATELQQLLASSTARRPVLPRIGAAATTAAWASDIVCCLGATALDVTLLRRGTHVIVPSAPPPLPSLAQSNAWLLAAHNDTANSELARMAAGIVDGRQLDEISVAGLAQRAIARTLVRRSLSMQAADM